MRGSGQRSQDHPVHEDDNDVEVKLRSMRQLTEVKRERLTKKTSWRRVVTPVVRSGREHRVRSVNAMQKPSTRTEKSIAKSRAEHIKHMLETDAVKDGHCDDAIKTAKILSGKIVDAHREKSRYCGEFADPSVFAVRC